MASQENSIKHLEKTSAYPFKTLLKIAEERTLSLFYEATITLIPKPDKDNT